MFTTDTTAVGGMPDGDEESVFDLVHHPTPVAAFASALAMSRALSGLSATPAPA
uniref:hypothetical protein n=1 Tax=Streptomyces anulatus TaxID=1892 RepID=UPI000A9B202B|nr:hypothetical protein [Streptomyces anulatus]